MKTKMLWKVTNFGAYGAIPQGLSQQGRFPICRAYIKPSNILTDVVFPAPFGPKKPNTSPRFTCRLRSDNGRFAAKLFSQMLRINCEVVHK